nr:hypothetical protein [Tanacetum cinerariifolium]
GKDSDDAVPVLGLELLGAFDKDKAHGPRGVDVLHDTRDVQHASGGTAVGLHIASSLEEGSNIGQPEQRRGGRR